MKDREAKSFAHGRTAVNCRSNENSLSTVPSGLLDYLASPMTHPWCPVSTWPHIPRCVLLTKFSIPDRLGAPSSLLTGPSFHMRSKPPTLFSLPVSLDRQGTQRVNEGALGATQRPKPGSCLIPTPCWFPSTHWLFPRCPHKSQRGCRCFCPRAPTPALSNVHLLVHSGLTSAVLPRPKLCEGRDCICPVLYCVPRVWYRAWHTGGAQIFVE